MSSRQDDTVWTQLTEGAIGRLGGAAIEVTRRAAAESRIAGAAQRSTTAWTRLAPAMKYRAVGALALAAVVTHIALLLPHHPPGVWWLILPSLVGAFGGVLVALSFLAPRSGATS